MDFQDAVGHRLLRGVDAIERAALLRPAAARVSDSARRVTTSRRVGKLLRGHWLGHALHPLLTDLTEGPWMAATFLDVFGPPGSEAAARRLLGAGVLAGVPTFLSGLAELAPSRDRGDVRLAAAHATTASISLALYAASYWARRRGAEASAKPLALAGGIVALIDGYLGGHLGHAREGRARR